MYCYVRNALPRVRWVCLVRLCYVFLLSCYLGSIIIVQPFLQKKKQILLVLVFSSPLECFTLEVSPAQLVNPHNLTTRPTQVSLCTCGVKKRVVSV
jgi:hypothetical protein